MNFNFPVKITDYSLKWDFCLLIKEHTYWQDWALGTNLICISTWHPFSQYFSGQIVFLKAKYQWFFFLSTQVPCTLIHLSRVSEGSRHIRPISIVFIVSCARTQCVQMICESIQLNHPKTWMISVWSSHFRLKVMLSLQRMLCLCHSLQFVSQSPWATDSDDEGVWFSQLSKDSTYLYTYPFTFTSFQKFTLFS